MDDVYENSNDYNPIRKRKKLIVFDDMIADILTNKKFQALIKELFIRCIKLNYFTCFYRSILFFGSKRCQIKYNRYFIMKLNNKKELQDIAINLSADIDHQDLKKNYRESTK